MSRFAIGLDVGGTKIAGGVVTDRGDVVERIEPLATPSDSHDDVVWAIKSLSQSLRGRHPRAEAIGVGAAGLIEWPAGFIRWAPNNAYRALPLRDLISDVTGLPTVVDNDANAAAWAEARVGHRCDDLAFLTIGTGVGGGIVLGGHLYRGRSGIGAEVGHLVVAAGSDHRCACGNMGCLEALASGTALGRFGRAAAEAEPLGTLARLAGGPSLVTSRTVHDAARAGDPCALGLFDRLGFWIGVGIASLVNLFDSALVVIGGGLVAAGDILHDPVKVSFERHVFAREHRDPPPIRLARMGNDAGWMGAGLLALEPEDRRPRQR